jgi:hypothetical protein
MALIYDILATPQNVDKSLRTVTNSLTKIGMSFHPRSGDPIKKAAIGFNTYGSPSGNLWIEIYSDSAGLPGSVVATSDSQSIASGNTFTFTGSNLFSPTVGTIYHAALCGDYALSDTNYIAVKYQDGTSRYYTADYMETYDGSSWSNSGLTTYNIYLKTQFEDGATADQSFTDTTNSNEIVVRVSANTNMELAMRFVPSVTKYISRFDFYCKQIGSALTKNCYVKLYSDSSGLPGTLLATSDLLIMDYSYNYAPASIYGYVSFWFTGTNKVSLTSGSTYYASLTGDYDVSASNAIKNCQKLNGTYTHGGVILLTSGTWTEYATYMSAFREYYDTNKTGGASGPANVKKMSTVAIASVKKVDSIAIASVKKIAGIA